MAEIDAIKNNSSNLLQRTNIDKLQKKAATVNCNCIAKISHVK